MKKQFIRIGEAVCVVLLVCFIVFISLKQTVSSKTVDEVAKQVCAATDTTTLKQGDELSLKKKFGIDAKLYDGFYYLSGEGGMDVRELLVIKLKDIGSQTQLTQALAAYVSDKTDLFESYAPEQYAMLKSHILIVEKGFVFLYVGQGSEAVSSAFGSAV